MTTNIKKPVTKPKAKKKPAKKKPAKKKSVKKVLTNLEKKDISAINKRLEKEKELTIVKDNVTPYSTNVYEAKDFLFKPGNQAAVKWTEKEALTFGADMLNWFCADERNVFFDEFIYIKCDRTKYRGKIYTDLPLYLCERFPSFSALYETIKKIEVAKLKSNGLNGTANAQIAKFLLSATHGISETTNNNVVVTTPIFNIDPLQIEE